ncbi:HD family phosphohydrolase [Shouchella lehensis]|uniref:Metal-dependent phosphohydrolase n=2 Tax=Shouchella lehensis TaxID=300825 RepID=A0A060M0J5_9BACI|nr:HD family phosphohydrolase [Shouchella lehensis]AIC94063.1 metal-dependent phosphohydrolase [Shouchella lehensis G1]RQW19981.1 HD family phosphohydrolase [Bacillus sp. C1-1]TES48158.1 HD family phosphohydrolase [Shouchella lehensis]
MEEDKPKVSAPKKWWRKIKQQPYIRTVIYTILGLIMYGMMLDNIIPEQLEVNLSEPAEQDIRAPMTVENRVATEQRRTEAVGAVESQMKHNRQYEEDRVQQVNDIFTVIRLEREQEADEEEEAPSISDQIENVRSDLSSSTNADLSDEALEVLLTTSDYQFQAAQEAAVNTVHETMSEPIKVGDLQEAKQNAENQIAEVTSLSPDVREAISNVVDLAIVFNVTYDAETTQRLRQEAADSIDPVLIREGELIVKAGDLVTYEMYEQLRLVGLLDEATVVFPYIGLALFVFILIGMLVYFLNDSHTTVATNNSHLLMFSIVFVVILVLMKLYSYLESLISLPGIGFAVPAAAGAMLLTLLLHPKIAIVTSFLFAIIGSVFYNHDSSSTFAFMYGFYILVGSLTGIYFLKQSNKATRILKAGFFVLCANSLTVLSILLMKSIYLNWVELSFYFLAAFLAAFVASVLTIGLLPFIETGFGILSTARLIELSSPNHPLLRKILTEAPGTYHHSVVVGNLAEAACETLGENGLLARVGAYYHDLGKTRRPRFFIENQLKGDNPHDKISPQLSKTIIISHPYDGADLLRQHKMPREIIDIAEQHHGTSLLKFFYYKAKQDDEKQHVPESQFRYPGPKPQTKVTSIISIADSVEAAVRSMQKPTPDKVEQLVDKIIKDKLEDGQFDESDLTLKELNQIKLSMCETLNGTFHQRIEYPDDDD